GNSQLSSFRQEEQYTSNLRLTQPLFRGLAEYAGLEIADLSLQVSRIQYERDDLVLFARVAELFYSHLRAHAEIAHLKELLENLRSRVTELSKRSRIGRADPADLLSARAQATL